MLTTIPKSAFDVATHFLCFPICNPRSRLQLQNFVQRLRDDEQAAGCPQKAFRMPKSFHLPIANFRFENRHDVEAASNLLRKLHVYSMLRHAATATLTAEASDQDQITTNMRFSSAGFNEFVLAKATDDQKQRTLRPELIDNRRAKKRHQFLDENRRKVSKQINSRYDARGLIEKYQGVVLAENISIEKLSLCREGRKATFQGARNETLVDEYYEEIDSIPMPQET
ncbi:MAG: hypothetical protein ASARMPREDX12_000357 [Alectoria sarmentosa]|nr:MAG: hypothetical protein ASARMPREDX12_000357 [Alectoria sarmentosa]